jgi:hypothetical protein
MIPTCIFKVEKIKNNKKSSKKYYLTCASATIYRSHPFSGRKNKSPVKKITGLLKNLVISFCL